MILFRYLGARKVIHTCHTYLTGPVEHNNVNGVDRQQYEKGRKGKDRSVTGLSHVPTAIVVVSCALAGRNAFLSLW